TLFEKDGNRQWKLNLGNVTLGEEKAVVYVTSSDKPKEAMAVKKVLLDNLFKGVTELRAKELLTDSALNVMYDSLDAAGKDPVILEQTDHQKWRFQKPPYGEADYDGEKLPEGRDPQSKVTGVQALLTTLEKIKVDDAADFVEDEAKDLAKYGLEDDKPAR